MTIGLVRRAGMVAVALAQAKARLSELVKLANAGEEVTITSRGVPVAQLVAKRPDRKPIDGDALRRFAATMPFQEESAGEFFERVRRDDIL